MTSAASRSRAVPWDWAIALAALVAYTILAFWVHSDEFIWDEDRYVDCAIEITKGRLVTDADPDFVNGPGYPLVLAPFVALKIPLVWARVLNGMFVAAAALLLYRTVRRRAATGWAIAATLATTFHPNLLRTGPYLMTEALTLLCVCAFLWCFDAVLQTDTRAKGKWILGAAVALTYLIMTRVFFGHVAMAMLLLSLLLWPLLRAWRSTLLRSAGVMALALLLCVPYLSYTQKKTGQFLCWSTNSGELLYWFTSHHPGENGHWFSYEDAREKPELAPNHKAFFDRVLKLHVLEREKAFKEQAKKNLAESPGGVFKNWLCNIPRLFFGFPRSFLPLEFGNLVSIVWNGPLLLLAAIAASLALRHWRKLTPAVFLIGLLVFVYLGGSTLAPSLPRYFLAIIPAIWLLTGQILSAHLKFSSAKP